MSSAVRHFEVIREIPLPRAAVWHVLSHTDRLNRHVGLSPVQYTDLDADKDGFFRLAEGKVGGFQLKWREYPFEWEQDARYSVVRLYEKGPLERFEGGIELEDVGTNATKVTIFSDLTGHGALGRALVPLVARRFLQNTLQFCDKYLLGDESNPQPRGPEPKPAEVSAHLLNRLILELKKRPIKPEYADALAEFLQTAGEGEVLALRPFEWAQVAGLDAHEALRTCLHAVKVGLLNMRWAMMCPNCRVSKLDIADLGDLANRVHCDLCGVGYDLDFDRYVELRFEVHPAVRRANAATFCSSGPFSAPHILMQKCISPGETAFFPVAEADALLRLRVLRSNQNIDIARGLGQEHFCFDGEKWSSHPGSGALTVKNCALETVCVALEKKEWDALAVTAARVTMLQEFRDLFSSQVLQPGRQVAIENVTIFFSDLSNSTALYESIGDASAFNRVGRHFDFLTQHIARHQGAVVKTMGDAVMAVFYDPENAVRAALAIQRSFHAFSATLSETEALNLKIGLHHGPALAVNSNDRLDYFGRTVNIASRVTNASQGNNIVITSQVWENSAVQRHLIEERVNLSRFETKLRGVKQGFALVRVTL